MNRKQKRRLWLSVMALVILSAVAALVFYALRQNINVYYTPTEIKQHPPSLDKTIRVGGMVVKGSVVHEPHSLTVHFVLSDLIDTLPVVYTGLLPALFREGQGIITEGHDVNGTLQATTVLAKHDETYHPPGNRQN